MNIASSTSQSAMAMARRSVLQSLPQKAHAFSSEIVDNVMSLSRGYLLEPAELVKKLRDQQLQMANGLRRLGHPEAAHATESRMGLTASAQPAER